MGYLPSAQAADGTTVYAELRGQRMPMKVSPMPFVPHSYKR
jgi:aminomethyltransferase